MPLDRNQDRNQVEVLLGATATTVVGDICTENSLNSWFTGTPSEFNFLVDFLDRIGGLFVGLV
jgi:hypothetical protein